MAREGQPVPLTAGRHRVLVAALALSAGRAVPVDRLTDAVWAADQPVHARRAVQTYLTRLRTALGPETIVTTSGGYLLNVAAEHVDALRFTMLLDRAAPGADPAAEYHLLRTALGLWRGDPLADIPSRTLTEVEAPRLVERHLAALERRIDLDLAGGNTEGLAAELSGLVARHPLRESLWQRLLVVLDRSGRQAEALRRYEELRTLLAEELGADPGPHLRQIHADLLAGRRVATPPNAPAGAPPARTAAGVQPRTTAGVQPRTTAGPTPNSTGVQPRTAGAASRPYVPRALPPAIDTLTGRDRHLAELDRSAAIDHGATSGGSGRVMVVHGPAGVGKTALVVYWGHRAAQRFPDGQLYVDLRGFDAADPPLSPADALRECLDLLRVAPSDVPAGTTARSGLLRGLLADRRVLVVLDNARDAAQVRPLLAGDGCLVVVTSRDELAGLVTVDGARPIELDLLRPDEATDMLANRLGQRRVAAEPDAVAEIVDRCGGLPLALAIVASRAVLRSDFPLSVFAEELRQTAGGLDGFTGPDAPADIRAVLSWSYRHLTPAAGTLFRLLAVHPGAEFATAAAASLAGVPPAQVGPPVTELTRTHLLDSDCPGRYLLHDLVRAYAAELVGDDERAAALGRIADHYLHTAVAAARLVDPHREPITVQPPRPGVTVSELADHAAAMTWLNTERTALLRLIERAGAVELDRHVLHLAWAVAQYLFLRADWADLRAVQRAALAAARRLGDRDGQARAHRTLAGVHSALGHHQEAHDELRRALELYTDLGNDQGRATVHSILGMVCAAQGRRTEAVEHAHRSATLNQAIGNRRGEGNARNEIGWYESQRGNHAAALRHCEQALAILEGVGDDHGTANAWDSIGHAQQHLDRPDAAIDSYRHAAAAFRRLGDRSSEAATLIRLGDVRAASDAAAARVDWLRALRILDELGHPDAAAVRQRL